MGRSRRREDLWMPSRVYRGRSAYELHPKKGGAIKLCPLDVEQWEVLKAYNEAVKKSALTVGELAASYFECKWFLRKKPSTQQQYRDCWKMLEKVWVAVDATKVKQKHVRKWMDARGRVSEVSANREHSVLQNIFSHGIEYSKVASNPCAGVKKFPETPRERYIEDDEYYPFLEKSSPLCRVLMELSYLQGSRGKEVRLIKMPDIRDVGVFIQTAKRGKKMVKEFTDRLEDAIALAKELRNKVFENLSERGKPNVLSAYLVVNNQGQPYTASGLKTIWAKNKRRVKEEHGIAITWTFHDIKAKGISDYEGDKQNFAGHQNARTTRLYDRKINVVPTVQSDLRPLKQ